jgi:putative spermidine/putrescine transport system permease protein
MNPSRALLHAFCMLVVVFVLAPIVVVIGTSFAASPIYEFPPQQLSLKWYQNLRSVPGLWSAFVLSIEIALLSTAAAVILGTGAAFALVRGNVPLREPLTLFLISPLMLPAIITGIALLMAFRSIGFDSSFWGVVIGHVVITTPYVVRTVLASMQLFQFSQLEAAATLGARPGDAFVRVLIPQIMPGIVAGALFAFVTSFDNYAVTMFLVDARSLTLPIKIINYTETSPDPTISAIATLLFVMSVIALVIGDRMVGLKKLSGVE